MTLTANTQNTLQHFQGVLTHPPPLTRRRTNYNDLMSRMMHEPFMGAHRYVGAHEWLMHHAWHQIVVISSSTCDGWVLFLRDFNREKHTCQGSDKAVVRGSGFCTVLSRPILREVQPGYWRWPWSFIHSYLLDSDTFPDPTRVFFTRHPLTQRPSFSRHCPRSSSVWALYVTLSSLTLPLRQRIRPFTFRAPVKGVARILSVVHFFP